MARVLQIKRGKKANMPTLAEGEFGFAMDSGAEELHIGTGGSNIQLARQDNVDTKLDKSGGTMTGALTAAADSAVTTAKVRNSSLNSTETTPTVNGAIAWTYE